MIVGLGNPGLAYTASRHNIGFQVVQSLAGTLKIKFKPDSLVPALVAKYSSSAQELVLALPQTYMNLSGIAVKALVKKFKVSTADLLIVCDDLDLALGRMKIRAQGSSGGQRGLKSIIEHLGRQDFNRLRIGIGRPKNSSREDAADYVLAGFPSSQRAQVKKIQLDAVSCCQSWLEKGIVETMNIFNLRSKNE